MNEICKYIGIIKNEYYSDIKILENKKLGITVKAMPAKIHGCFQNHLKNVTVIIDETVIGQTCNGSEFSENEDKVLEIIKRFSMEKSKKY